MSFGTRPLQRRRIMGHFWTDKNAMAWQTHVRVESVTNYNTGASFANAKSTAHKEATGAGLLAVDIRWNVEEKHHEDRLLGRIARRNYKDANGNIKLATITMS